MNKEKDFVRWFLMAGIPVLLFIAFYLGLQYGFSTAEGQLAEYRQQQDQTTSLMLSSILHKLNEQGVQQVTTQ